MIRGRRQRQGGAICAAPLATLVLAAPAMAAPAYSTQWGGGGDAEGQFTNPRGVAVDSAGNVYVVDSSNHRVQKFDANGGFQRMWGLNVAGGGQPEVCTSDCQSPTATSTLPGAFSNPFGIVVSSDSVYVADRGNSRIQRFELDGTNPRTWGAIGPGAGQR